ncbi:MAG: hypothetical protein JXR86_14905 [Spirochaetales bacterium]|nr:hypothetical protein [Spirochaetales bacterium]
MNIHQKGIVLDREWNILKLGNPVPGLYNQNGSEVVKVRGTSEQINEEYITDYEIVILDKGHVIATYKIHAVESVEATDKNYTSI